MTHSSGGLGQIQGDAIRNIYGEARGPGSRAIASDTGGAFSASGWGGGPAADGDWSANHSLYFDASRTVPTANENRPVNKAVRYLVRARP